MYLKNGILSLNTLFIKYILYILIYIYIYIYINIYKYIRT